MKNPGGQLCKSLFNIGYFIEDVYSKRRGVVDIDTAFDQVTKGSPVIEEKRTMLRQPRET